MPKIISLNNVIAIIDSLLKTSIDDTLEPNSDISDKIGDEDFWVCLANKLSNCLGVRVPIEELAGFFTPRQIHSYLENNLASFPRW